jgi:hypothetical protein
MLHTVAGHIIELLETPKALGTNLSGKPGGGSAQEMVTIQEMQQWAISSEASKGGYTYEERSETKW